MMPSHDPHFTSGDAWRGGIPEMATKYIEMIKAVVSYGHVILGGVIMVPFPVLLIGGD